MFKTLRKKNQEIEKEEEKVRTKVSKLNKTAKKKYFELNSKELLDPDTYATINWVFFAIGGHHFYAKKYKQFLIEFCIALIALSLYLYGSIIGIILFIGLFIYELPFLFFSQKIIRIRNLDISNKNYKIAKEEKEKINEKESTITIENE